METFKKNWEIKHNWQLIFPVMGIVGLLYSSYKIAAALLKDFSLIYSIGLSLVIFVVLLKFTLFLFEKLKHRWILKYRWEMIRVFLVFAFTGTSSVFVSKYLMQVIGITKDNLNTFLYWVLYIIFSLVFYQILLLMFGWLLGQFQFFWNFEKKILQRFKLEKQKK